MKCSTCGKGVHFGDVLCLGARHRIKWTKHDLPLKLYHFKRFTVHIFTMLRGCNCSELFVTTFRDGVYRAEEG